MRKDRARTVLIAVLTSSAIPYLVFAVLAGTLFNSRKAHINWLNKWQHTAAPHIQAYEHSGGNTELPDKKVILRYYQKLDQIYPDNNLIQGALGSCFYFSGEKEDAVKHYKKAIALNPGLYIFYWDLGMASFHAGDLPLAAKLLAESLKRMPSFEQMLSERRRQLLASGQENLLPLLEILNLRKEQDKAEAARVLTKLYALIHKGIAVESEPGRPKIHFGYDLLTLRLWVSSQR